MKCAYKIPNIFNSLAKDVEAGKITMEEAAVELHEANATPYCDVELTKKKLAPYMKEVQDDRS